MPKMTVLGKAPTLYRVVLSMGCGKHSPSLMHWSHVLTWRPLAVDPGTDHSGHGFGLSAISGL